LPTTGTVGLSIAGISGSQRPRCASTHTHIAASDTRTTSGQYVRRRCGGASAPDASRRRAVPVTQLGTDTETSVSSRWSVPHRRAVQPIGGAAQRGGQHSSTPALLCPRVPNATRWTRPASDRRRCNDLSLDPIESARPTSPRARSGRGPGTVLEAAVGDEVLCLSIVLRPSRRGGVGPPIRDRSVAVTQEIVCIVSAHVHT